MGRRTRPAVPVGLTERVRLTLGSEGLRPLVRVDPRRAYARSGDRIALAACLGGSDRFDRAVADFAETYADQNERDYAALRAAVKDGRVQAATEI